MGWLNKSVRTHTYYCDKQLCFDLTFDNLPAFMDPRIAWYPPEQLGPAHHLWTRIWDTQYCLDSMSGTPLIDQKPQDFIPLGNESTGNNSDALKRQEALQKRKRQDNRACTYGLNFPVNIRVLQDGGLTPWRKKRKMDENSYEKGVVG